MKSTNFFSLQSGELIDKESILIVNALPLLGDGPFLVLNGDIYTDLPFAELPRGLPPGALGHLIVTPRPTFRERGDFLVADGHISARGDDYVYCGIAVLDPRALAGRRATPFSLRDVFFALLAGRRLTAQIWAGRWTDLGTLDQLAELNAELGDRRRRSAGTTASTRSTPSSPRTEPRADSDSDAVEQPTQSPHFPITARFTC